MTSQKTETMREPKKISDITLVNQFKRGSLAAYEELIHRYESKIFNMAMRFTRNHEDAEEVLQDVFTTLYNKIEGFQGKSAFSSWLYRIVVNAAFMKLRKRKQNHTVSFEDLVPALRQSCMDQDLLFSTRAESFTSTREVREILSGAIQRLPDQYRAVFILRDVDGMSNQEVAEILSLSIPAVKSRLHRSRLMLRKKLVRYYSEYRGKQFKVELEDADSDGAEHEAA